MHGLTRCHIDKQWRMDTHLSYVVTLMDILCLGQVHGGKWIYYVYYGHGEKKTKTWWKISILCMGRGHWKMTRWKMDIILKKDEDMVENRYINNNNNNLFLRSRPSQRTKLVYETPLFVGQGTPLRPTIMYGTRILENDTVENGYNIIFC
jgi:hypothetical protein